MIGANSLNLRAKQISCGHIIMSSKEMSVIKGGTSSKGKIIGIDCFKGEEKKKKVGGGEEEIWDAEEVEETGHYPEHLVVMVNGIVGSADDWKFAAQQFVKKLPDKVIVHRNECNSSRLTFDGVDLMGERLAEEVLSVVKRRHGVQKISFVAHSLSGLIARHAIGRLYEPSPQSESSVLTGNLSEVHSSISGNSQERLSEGKIAGLEPLNFITFATPHLGSRGNKQLPLLCVCQCKLRSVGWRTSSIRRQHELPKYHLLIKLEKYPHIVYVEKESDSASHIEGSTNVTCQAIDLEEEMIRGLSQVHWERVDVSFRRSRQRYIAHNTILVKSYWMNSDGADAVFHMIDNFLL